WYSMCVEGGLPCCLPVTQEEIAEETAGSNPVNSAIIMCDCPSLVVSRPFLRPSRVRTLTVPHGLIILFQISHISTHYYCACTPVCQISHRSLHSNHSCRHLCHISHIFTHCHRTKHS